MSVHHGGRGPAHVSRITTAIDPDAALFFARMATGPSWNFRQALSVYIRTLKAGGVWSKLTALQILGGETQTDSYKNLIGSGQTLSASGGSVAFEAGKGMTGDGAARLTGWGADNAVIASSGDLTMSFVTTKTGNVASHIGLSAASFNVLIQRAGSLVDSRMFNSGSRQTNLPAGVGSITVRRTGTNVYVDANGANLLTTTDTPAAGTGQPITIMGAVTARSTDRFFMVALGTYLDATQSAILHSATTTLAAALGWQQPTSTAYTRAAASSTVLPSGVSHGTANKGFTCTGLVKDSADGTWWVVNYGMATGVDTRAASVVHLSADFSTVLSEITMASLGIAATVELQGICEDTTAGDLYVCNVAGSIYKITKAGALSATLAGMGAINGIAYDSINDKLIVGTVTTIQRATKAGSYTGQPLFRLPYEVDQLSFVPSKNWLLASSGNNGSQGVLSIFELDGDYGTYPRLLKEITLTSFLAAEGIYLDGNTLYAVSDEYFHAVGTSTNTVQTYDLTGLVS